MREERNFLLFASIRKGKDGSLRMIRNLKQLNKHHKYKHFKIESLQSVWNITRPNCPDGLYRFERYILYRPNRSITFKVSQDHRYACREMPNRYCEATRVLTKLPNPPFSILRSYFSFVYVDDC